MGPLCRESHPFLFFVIVQAGQNPGPCTSVSTSTLLAAPTYNTSHTRSMWLSPLPALGWHFHSSLHCSFWVASRAKP